MSNEEHNTDGETDTEDHAVKPRGIEPAGEEDDDTDGHRLYRHHVGVAFD